MADVPQFLLQRNGNPVGCSTCGSALAYPAIRIPDGPPTYKLVDGGMGLWSWTYSDYCLSCAIKKIKKLRPVDLTPVIGEKTSG